MNPPPPVTFQGAAGVALLALALFVPRETLGFDPARYRPQRLGDLVRTRPTEAGIVVTPDEAIRSKVVYSGQSRPLQDDSRRLIAAWAKTMNQPEVPGLFAQEVKVREGDAEYWLPAQRILVRPMTSELRPEEEIEVFVIYIGQVDRRHVFLLNAFEHDGPHPPGR